MSVEFRRHIYEQLEVGDAAKKGLTLTNWFLLFLILFSLALYTAETEREIDLGDGTTVFYVNFLILTVFAVEFVARIYAAGTDPRYRGLTGLKAYVSDNRFMTLVDFLAFAPELVVMALGVPPPSWLRSLRIFRLFKIARYMPAFRLVVDALHARYQELLAALSISVVLWFVAAAVLYLAESSAQPEAFGSITRSMWWSVVTLTTVGYGDVYPVTAAGKIAAGAVAVLGMGAIALPSGIIAGAFVDKLRERREDKPQSVSSERGDA